MMCSVKTLYVCVFDICCFTQSCQVLKVVSMDHWSTNAFFTIHVQETVRKSQDVEFLKIYMPWWVILSSYATVHTGNERIL